MDPLIATMDQSSIGNTTKLLTSGPNSKEHNSKLLHKIDQETTSPLILSPSNLVSSSFDGFSPKNNIFSGPNNHCHSNNHRQYDDLKSRDTQHDIVDDYDDNKDVVVVMELNNKAAAVSNNHGIAAVNITRTMENISIDGSAKFNKHSDSKDLEGISRPSQTPAHSIAPNRTSPSITPTSSTKNRDISEACHHQLPSSSPTSALPVRPSGNIVSSNGRELGNHIVCDGTASKLKQQRRLLPIIKAQSLDFACYDDPIHPHLQNNHYSFQTNNHHLNHHRNHLHNQHLYHFNHFSYHSSGKRRNVINKGCSLDNQRFEDEGVPPSTINTGDPSTEDVDADVDEDDDEDVTIQRAPTLAANSLRSHTMDEEMPSTQHHHHRNSFDSASSTGDTTDSSQHTDAGRLTSSPQPRQHGLAKGLLPKVQSLESRPIYPNVPYSPYASPYGSPRSNRRRTPLRESRRISIEQSGSFLQLNQYKLMDQIGQGSYGLVKLAYSEEDSTHYAMKILSKRRLLRKAGLMSRGPKKTTSPLDRVYREIAVLKKLDHPNVVKLVEVLDDPLEDSLYLVFELVKQGEVLEIPTEKPLTEERTWSVFRDAVQGLEYLHYQRIIHADIKPGNLLLTECGHVKIADLGVCNEFLGEDATMNNGSTAGTPAFRAPETLFPGQHLYSGKAADIWALGATLYSLVFGNVPFVASSIPLLYEKVKNETLSIPEKPVVSEELVDLIKKMLTKDPAKRITLPQIKEHPWLTANGVHILPSEDDNCRLVQVSEEDINSVVKSIPKLDTLILIKTMLKNHSFLNPFNRGISGRAPQRGGSRLERFTRAGRSNSAPGAYHSPIDRQLSGDSILPALSEHIVSSNNEITEDS